MIKLTKTIDNAIMRRTRMTGRPISLFDLGFWGILREPWGEIIIQHREDGGGLNNVNLIELWLTGNRTGKRRSRRAGGGAAVGRRRGRRDLVAGFRGLGAAWVVRRGGGSCLLRRRLNDPPQHVAQHLHTRVDDEVDETCRRKKILAV